MKILFPSFAALWLLLTTLHPAVLSAQDKSQTAPEKSLAAPSNLHATQTSLVDITLVWQGVTGATSGAVPGSVHTYSVSSITPRGRSRTKRSNAVTPRGQKGQAPIELRAVFSSRGK
jgi:hypothetical protein